MKKKLVCIVLILAALFFSRAGFAKTEVPGRTQCRVNDYAGILDGKTKGELELALSSIPQRTPDPVEVIIAIFADAEGWRLEDFAREYGEQWRRSKKGRDNGVILMVFFKQQRIMMGVGQNLKGILTDDKVDGIIKNTALPMLKEGDYDGGIKKTAETIVSILNQAEIPMDKPNVLLKVISAAVILTVIALIFTKVRILKR